VRLGLPLVLASMVALVPGAGAARLGGEPTGLRLLVARDGGVVVVVER
jgi:hypothetical protein